jgi:hypothetical protein
MSTVSMAKSKFLQLVYWSSVMMYQVPSSLSLKQPNSIFPEFAPRDFFLLTNIKTIQKRQKFGSMAKIHAVMTALKTWDLVVTN